MQTFTMGTPEMIGAMFSNLPQKYPMELNETDMSAVIWALATAVGFVSWDDREAEDADELRERAESLFSSIAETLGVEGI